MAGSRKGGVGSGGGGGGSRTSAARRSAEQDAAGPGNMWVTRSSPEGRMIKSLQECRVLGIVRPALMLPAAGFTKLTLGLRKGVGGASDSAGCCFE